MNVNPNKFDSRVMRKFKTQLTLTDKDIETELKRLPEEPDQNYTAVTGITLEETESRSSKNPSAKTKSSE